MAKVSIIIPTYNVEPYLRECLNSVVGQTLKDIEIICVNDGSTDNSLEIIEEYAKRDGRIIVITGQNGGYGKAMNKGLDRATGEYIGIVEPDDYIALNMYEELYSRAREYNVDIVKADFYRFTREANGNMHLVYNHLSNEQSDYNRVLCPIEEQRSFRFIMNTWSGIYRRSFIEKYKIRHNETPGASYQDNGFWFQTFTFAKQVMFIDKPYYRNRRDNPSSSMYNRTKVYSMNVEYAYIRDLIMAYPELWERIKYIFSFKRYQNYIGTINRVAHEYKRQYILDISEEFKKAERCGELSPEAFLPNEWSSLQFIKDDPENYYLINVLRGQQEKELQRELDLTRTKLCEVEESTTYKVGKTIMFIPCRVKDFLIRKN